MSLRQITEQVTLYRDGVIHEPVPSETPDMIDCCSVDMGGNMTIVEDVEAAMREIDATNKASPYPMPVITE